MGPVPKEELKFASLDYVLERTRLNLCRDGRDNRGVVDVSLGDVGIVDGLASVEQPRGSVSLSWILF